MASFHGQQTMKDFYMDRLLVHYKLDEFEQGIYWHEGGFSTRRKGCAVGCTVHTKADPHQEYWTIFNIPEWVAHLEDRLFESMSVKDSKEFPLQFLGAIPVGVDAAAFDKLLKDFVYWLLTDPEHVTVKGVTEGTLEYDAVKKVTDLIYDTSDQRIRELNVATDMTHEIYRNTRGRARTPLVRKQEGVADVLYSTVELLEGSTEEIDSVVYRILAADAAITGTGGYWTGNMGCWSGIDDFKEKHAKAIADKFVTMLDEMAPRDTEINWVDNLMQDVQQPGRVLALIQ